MTLDIDLVVQIQPDQMEAFRSGFPVEEFYVPPTETVQQEIQRAEKGHFTLVHHKTGFKADVYPAGADPLQRWALENARNIDFGGHKLPIAPPEYVIIKKLQYYHEGRSEKHLRDITAMLVLSSDIIDPAIVERYVVGTPAMETWTKLASRSSFGKKNKGE